jgi:hypothetical protein
MNGHTSSGMCFSYSAYSLNISLPVEIVKGAADIGGIPEIKHQNFPLKYDTNIEGGRENVSNLQFR